MSEADAGEDEGDQIASPYGSRPTLAGARSPRLDWSVLLPVRQHVPSHFGEPEHEWKDENPWPSAPDLSDLSDHSTCQNQGAPPSGSAAAKVRAETLTRIMDGRVNAIQRTKARAVAVDDASAACEAPDLTNAANIALT